MMYSRMLLNELINKIKRLINLALLILIYCYLFSPELVASSQNISGQVFHKNLDDVSIDFAYIALINSVNSCYSDEKGMFNFEDINAKKNGKIFISRYGFIPQITNYNSSNYNKLIIELLPNYDYYFTPPLSGPLSNYDTLYLRGTVIDKATRKPISGVIIYLADLPYSTVSDKSGQFTLKPSSLELNYYVKKDFTLYFERKGYQNEIYSFSKEQVESVIDQNLNYLNIGQFELEKYYSSDELDQLINIKLMALTGNIEVSQVPTFDTTIFETYDKKISEIQRMIFNLKIDTLRLSQYESEIEKTKSNQDYYFALLKKEHELDSIYLLSLQFLDSAISSNNNSIKNLNAIDETIATSLSELGVDITSTRNDLNKRIEESIIVFNENARILNESYLKRSRQYDTTALQVFATIPVTLGPRYPDFVSTRTFGQIGINTNFGFHFLQRSKIYTSFSYNLLSFDKKDTNYHTGADNKTLFANTENVSANFFAFAVNIRPPIDFITNLKIDPGVGLSIGYDYKKIENGKINDSVAKIGIQAYIQVVVQYKLYTPPSDFNDYNPKSFMNNQNEFNNLLGSGQIDSSKYANKYKGLYENYNYKKSKYIKRRHVFQNLGHNTYLYFAVSDRLVFNEKKYLYGLANFSLGLKFDLSSFVKNQSLLKKSCVLSDYCNPGKPID